MGGRGGNSGMLAGKSSRQSSLQEARNTLRENGYTQYDRLPELELSTAARRRYAEMEMAVQNGDPITSRFSKGTKEELLQKVQADRLSNAMSLIKSDYSDQEALSWYEKRKKWLNKIDNYVRGSKGR